MLSTPAIPAINPALTGTATEVFQHEGELYFLHDGRRGTWAEMPTGLVERFRIQLAKDTTVLQHLLNWAAQEPMDILRRYVECNFGGYDKVPDIGEDGQLQACEYHNCGRRGRCGYEGKVCQSIQVAYGALTKTEVQVLRHAHHPTKHIAFLLSISPDTVNSHLKSLSRKTGYTRPGLVQLAIIRGLHQ